MKIIFSLILTFVTIFIFGQQLEFKGQLVDTIYIKSHRSSYQFDSKGTTLGKANVISIAFDSLQNKYIIDRFFQDEYKGTFRPKTINTKTETYKTEIGNALDFAIIGSLLKSLSTNTDIKDLINQVDTTELSSLLTEKHIRKVAKWYKIDWNFKRRYSTKEQNLEFFKGCKSIDTLKVYLSERFDNSGYVMVTDYSNTINIWITTSQSEYRFEGKYPNPIKQPWYNHCDSSQSDPNAILNLEINYSLSKLLPNDFLLKNTISNEALVNDYITWYFERRKLIF